MAAGGTAESVLGSILSHLECSICHTRYQEPKMLDCSHSFCLRCIQELKQSQQPDDGKITCPLCQRQTILPEGGVAKLNKNYTLMSLVDEVSKQEQILKGAETEGPAVVVCQACDEENEATVQCTDCEQFLCQYCLKAHQRWAALRNHKIITLLNRRDVPQTEMKTIIKNCGDHPSQKLCFYCTTCEQLICNKCLVSGHNAPMHTCVEVHVAFDVFLQEARETNTEMGQFYTHVSRDREYSRSRLSRMLSITSRDISSEAASKIAHIRGQEMRLLQEANAAYRKKDRRLAEVILAQQTLKKTEAGKITDEDRLEILKLRQDLLSEYKDLNEKTRNEVNSHLSFTACKEECNKVELGTLNLEENWELVKEFELNGSSIATFSSGNIAMTCGTRGLTFLGLNDQEEYTIHESKDTHLLKSPTDMAVTMDDVLFVANYNGVINIFNKGYQFIQQFNACEESHINATPVCLAVDDSELLAVGYKGMDRISLHTLDGSLIRTVHAPMIANHLVISNKRLTYTNSDKKKLMSLDYHGNSIFTVDSFQNSAPRGLCCDKAGDFIVIAYCRRKGLNNSVYQIHRYSAEGRYIDTLVKDVGNRTRIANISDGKIVVTGDSQTQIYHRI
ncbi:tripartite motif-containing protein 45-like [Patiria miniata]|uniref:E3 ubiquitin-protein ligase TRIM56 n=1 Tax=Patiria miniata TaxID=46514 RepID=A0A914A557_PATMI|nr:tripartite motif-containing protein 45-like [Patiria miniata]